MNCFLEVFPFGRFFLFKQKVTSVPRPSVLYVFHRDREICCKLSHSVTRRDKSHIFYASNTYIYFRLKKHSRFVFIVIYSNSLDIMRTIRIQIKISSTMTSKKCLREVKKRRS